MPRFVSVAILAAALSITATAQRGGGPAGPQQSTPPEPLKFRYMGPAAAGRIATVAGVPGDPNVYFLGSASGGVLRVGKQLGQLLVRHGGGPDPRDFARGRR